MFKVEVIGMAGCADAVALVDHVASSSSSAVVPVVANASALYAIVSRNRTTPSQTVGHVTVSSGSSTAVAPADMVVVDARRDLYTRVVRRQDGRRGTLTTANTQSSTMVPPPTGRTVRVSSADGYASIDDPPPRPQNYAGNSVSFGGNIVDGGNSVDFYDVIRDDVSVAASSDFDPNYEMVIPQTTSSQPVTSAAAVAASNNNQQTQNTTVVTTSDSGRRGRQTDAARQHGPGGLLIREHIYDEVSSPTTRYTSNIRQTDL